MEKTNIKLILSSLRQKTGRLFVNIWRWLLRWACWRRGLLSASLVIIGLCLFVFLKLEITASAIYYLLSATSQGLAAILAIILSATLIAGQLASRYSPKLLREAFKPGTIFYVALFIVSVALPLGTLANTDIMDIASSIIWVKLSLIVAGACLAFLIPYFLSLKEWLLPENLIESLYKKAFKQLQYEKDELPVEAETIVEMIKSLHGSKTYGAFECGLQKLTQLVKDMTPLPRKEGERDEPEGEKQEESIGQAPHLAHELIEMLRHIGILVVDDPEAIRGVVKNLGDCALIVQDLKINEEIMEGLEEAVGGVIEHGREAPCELIASEVGGIGGKAAARAQPTTAKRLLEVLWGMSSFVLDRPWDKAERQVIEAIYSVGNIAADSAAEGVQGMTRVSTIAIQRLWDSYEKATRMERFNIADVASYRVSSLGWKVVSKGLEGPTRTAIKVHGKIAQETINLGRKEASGKKVEELIKIGKKAVEKLPKEVAIEALEWLTTIGSLVYKDNETLAGRVIEGLGTIGKEAAVQAKPEIVKEAANALSSLAEKINSAKPQLASLISAQLWKLGSYAMELLPEEQAFIKNALNSLKSRVGEKALETGFKEVEQSAASPELFEFKDYYETNC